MNLTIICPLLQIRAMYSTTLPDTYRRQLNHDTNALKAGEVPIKSEWMHLFHADTYCGSIAGLQTTPQLQQREAHLFILTDTPKELVRPFIQLAMWGTRHLGYQIFTKVRKDHELAYMRNFLRKSGMQVIAEDEERQFFSLPALWMPTLDELITVYSK